MLNSSKVEDIWYHLHWQVWKMFAIYVFAVYFTCRHFRTDQNGIIKNYKQYKYDFMKLDY